MRSIITIMCYYFTIHVFLLHLIPLGRTIPGQSCWRGVASRSITIPSVRFTLHSSHESPRSSSEQLPGHFTGAVSGAESVSVCLYSAYSAPPKAGAQVTVTTIGGEAVQKGNLIHT